MEEKQAFRKIPILPGLVAVLAIVPCLGQELPPEIQIDLLLVAAERYQEEGNPYAATEAL